MEAVLAYLADTDGAQLEGAQYYVRNESADPTELPVDADGGTVTSLEQIHIP